MMEHVIHSCHARSVKRVQWLVEGDSAVEHVMHISHA